MSDLAGTIDDRYQTLVRRALYPLLTLATAIAVLTMPLFDRGPLGWTTVAVLVPAVAGAHAWVVDRRWGRTQGPDRLSTGYLLLRAVAALVLTLVNPFFAVLAFIGYFDSLRHAPPRLATPLVMVTALTMAGAQSGGLPPATGTQALGFVGLFALNAVLALFFIRLGRDEEQLAGQRVATIAELERTNARLADALAENADLQAELVQRARDSGRHEERERLALEIHDTLAQSLVGVVTQVQAAQQDPTRAADRLERALALARSALVDARRSVAGLMPAALDDAELATALDQLVQDWQAGTGGTAELTVTGRSRSVPAPVEAAVLRVAGEALTNVDRHAAAGRVGVTLSFMDDSVVLDVRDDGAGFLGPPAPGRFGLRGMHQRADRVGGRLEVESTPGAGTAVSFRVPVHRA